jgi:hypothetical protein
VKNTIDNTDNESLKETLRKPKACLNENTDCTQVRRIVNICKLIGNSTERSCFIKISNRVEKVFHSDEYR